MHQGSQARFLSCLYAWLPGSICQGTLPTAGAASAAPLCALRQPLHPAVANHDAAAQCNHGAGACGTTIRPTRGVGTTFCILPRLLPAALLHESVYPSLLCAPVCRSYMWLAAHRMPAYRARVLALVCGPPAEAPEQEGLTAAAVTLSERLAPQLSGVRASMLHPPLPPQLSRAAIPGPQQRSMATAARRSVCSEAVNTSILQQCCTACCTHRLSA